MATWLDVIVVAYTLYKLLGAVFTPMFTLSSLMIDDVKPVELLHLEM